jgi:hypothetical protein
MLCTLATAALGPASKKVLCPGVYWKFCKHICLHGALQAFTRKLAGRTVPLSDESLEPGIASKDGVASQSSCAGFRSG